MELNVLLERMKLEHLETRLAAICESATQREMNYREFLAEALETEWSGRHQRGIQARLKMARFPWVKTLEQFDFDFQPSVDRKLVRELSGLAFVERAHNVVLLGPPGVGKTHLAVALGVKAVEAGYTVLIPTQATLITRLGLVVGALQAGHHAGVGTGLGAGGQLDALCSFVGARRDPPGLCVHPAPPGAFGAVREL